MKVTDLIVEVRNSSLARVGQILPVDLNGFTAVLRFRAIGSWTLTLPTNHALADALRSPGAGLIVTGPTGVLFSGPTASATRSQSQEDPEGSWEIRGLTDNVILGERLAYPVPTTADVTAQTAEFDTRTGKASTLIYNYINANIGPSAPTARKITGLTLAADPGVGSTLTGNARFETLGTLLTRLAQIDGLGFDIKQNGSGLQFSVYAPTDRSSTVRMDVDNNMLSKSEYTYTAPEVTRAIVGGSGSGASRTFAEVTTSLSTAAETAWGRRIETFKDSRSGADSAALTQAGNEELATKGTTIEAISVSPSDDSTMAYGTDWNLGDKVAIVVGSSTITQIVTEVGMKISEDGIRIGATVGEPSAADPESTPADVAADQEDRISNLETNNSSVPADSGVTTTKLADNSVTTAKVADSAITSAKIADGTIVNADISATAAIATSKISGLDTALAGKASTASVALKADLAGPTFTGDVNMNNFNIANVNALTFNDPGAGEGVSWLGGNLWKIYEAPDDLSNAAGNLQIVQNATRRLTLDTAGNTFLSGNLYGYGLSGTTSWYQNDGSMLASGCVYSVNSGGIALALSRQTSNGNIAQFYRGTATIVGSISVTTTATAYNTSSDYRLKENIEPIGDPCERVKALKPIRYNFISEPDEIVDGFLAHEAQEVVPNAVTGEKDEVDENGDPVYQAIDHSKLVPLLTAALQSALEKIETLEDRISALENR